MTKDADYLERIGNPRGMLTISQMAYLVKLEVDTSNASYVLICRDEDGNEIGWDEIDEVSEYSEIFYSYYHPESSEYDHSFQKDCRLFCFTDLLKLCPHTLMNDYCFHYEVKDDHHIFGYKKLNEDKYLASFDSTDKVKALYDLVVCVITKATH